MTTWLPTETVANLEGISARWVRKRALAGAYGEIEKGKVGRNARAILVSLDRLSPSARARYRQSTGQPALRIAEAPLPSDLPIHSFDTATPSQKQRAVLRESAIVAYQTWLMQFGARRGIKAARANWVRHYKAAHPEIEHLSPASLLRWTAAYEAFGRDGLVDRNDGSSRRGRSVIPERVREIFVARYTDGTCPTKAMVIEEVRAFAEAELGLSLDDVSDDAFYRIEIPEGLLRATREDQDIEERSILTLRRDHNFPALHIVVADHHITDLWVHCGDGGYTFDGQSGRVIQIPAARVCEGECKHGHRVWITAWMDVASRKVLSWYASLDYPSAETVKRSLRALIVAHGVPNIVYCDNGKDFKSAFGKAIRRGEALPIDENVVNNLLASLGIRVIFARPRKGRSKSIERLFRTWVMQIWQGRPEYVGALGKRRESAKALYKQPHLMASLDEFRTELALRIEAYNLKRGHRGQGMNGRSPEEVFQATRIQRREPEENGFKIAFWTWYGRQVQAGGACTIGADRYILDPLVGPSFLGKNVQILVDPEDVRRAIVLTGCNHTTSRLPRTKSLTCECAGKGRFLCEATFEGLSSYVDNEVTSEHLRTRDRINKEWRRQVRDYRSLSAARDLETFRRGNRLLKAIVERERRQHRQAVAQAVGAESLSTVAQVQAPVTVMLPQSSIARSVDRYRETRTTPALTPAQIERAARAEDHTDEYLELIAAPHGVGESEADDPLYFEAELDRVRAARERSRKERDGECLECTEPVWAGKFCRDHYRHPD